MRSPGVGVAHPPKLHPATTRSFSLHETAFLRFGGGSLTSGQPINRHVSASGGAAAGTAGAAGNNNNASGALVCGFCQLKFPNEVGLEAHEPHCSKKDMLHKQQSQPQLKLASSLQPQQHNLQQQQQQLQLQLQQLEHHQSTIAALVGGGKGVARDLIINGGASGRASVSENVDHLLLIRKIHNNTTLCFISVGLGALSLCAFYYPRFSSSQGPITGISGGRYCACSVYSCCAQQPAAAAAWPLRLRHTAQEARFDDRNWTS